MAVDTLQWNWRVEQGERVQLVIPVLNVDDDYFPVDDWIVDAKVKTEPGGTVLYTWPEENITTAGPTVTLLIPVEVSEAWTWRAGYYRVKITDPATTVDDPGTYRILSGAFVVDAD